MKKMFCIAVAVAAFAVVPVHAQMRAGQFEVGADLGVTQFDDKLGDDSDARVAIRGGYFVTRAFELEAQLATSATIFDQDLSTAMVNAVWNFGSDRRFSPYVLGGIGIATLQDNRLFSDNDEDSDLALQAAVGTRFWIGSASRWGIRVEASALNEETLDENSTHLTFSGGVVYRFR